MKRVLILCTGNSCRSQMAEAIWNATAASWTAQSAGSHPSGKVHPLAIRAICELQASGFSLEVSTLESKHLDQFVGQDFDLVVTVCDNAKRDCPVFSSAKTILHWPFEDPAEAEGTESEQFEVFRRVRDQIHTKIAEYLGQPLAS